MTETERAQLVRRGLDAWNRRDLAAMLSMCDPEIEWVNAPNAVEPGVRHGHEGMRTVCEAQWEVLVDAQLRTERVVERGDGVVSIGSVSSRMPGSDSVLEAPFHILWHVAGGRFTRIEPLGPDDAAAQAEAQ
jgi:ketosteroid isomerase-like protein